MGAKAEAAAALEAETNLVVKDNHHLGLVCLLGHLLVCPSMTMMIPAVAKTMISPALTTIKIVAERRGSMRLTNSSCNLSQ